MLYTLAVILLIAWLLGVVGTYTIGAFVHALLVIAIVLFIIGFLNGRRTPVARRPFTDGQARKSLLRALDPHRPSLAAARSRNAYRFIPADWGDDYSGETEVRPQSSQRR
jgi:hypothetical protein